MRQILVFVITFCILAGSNICQAAPLNDPLLERLAGTWVLRGTIARKQTTHDVVADWMLDHQYLRIHEVSREKNDKGKPQYEAVVLIGWDANTSSYQCLWLDTTGGDGLRAEGIGQGKRDGDAIPFIFKERDGSISFSNTFSFDKTDDSWSWKMDNIKDGKAIPFGLVKLTRR
ncbi:MAG: hypothetical protein HY255_07810 [Betaproteobacteria bacterium]|nr:hypothetical protein [Betaproteobacteria bacterium]